jgi:spore coat protein H
VKGTSTNQFTTSGKKVNNRHFRSIASVGIIGLILIGLLFIFMALGEPADKKMKASTVNADNIFQYSKIHEIHLQFKDTTAWKSLAPYGGMIGAGDWFDISAFISSPFYAAGDTDFDRQFTKDEFLTLGEKWFRDWDTNGQGQLDANMIAVGYNNAATGFDLRGAPGRRNGIASILGVQIPEGKANITFDNNEMKSAVIRYKGNGTLLQAEGIKYSLKIDLNDSFPGRSFNGIDKINLHNLVMDPGYMTDAISYRLFREAKVPASRTSYAKVYIDVPDSLDNHYAGLYLLLENVDNDFAMHWFGTKKGAIFKPVTPNFFQFMGDDWNNYIQSYDPKTSMGPQETHRIIETCKFVSTASDEEFSAKIHEYFDVDNLARYLAVEVFLVEIDGLLGPGQNMYLYLHPKTLQLSLIPWDHDQSFGRMPRGTLAERDSLSLEKPWMMGNVFIERLFKEPQFNALYLKYMKEFNETLFTPERIISQIEELTPILRPAVELESKEKLQKFDAFVGSKPRPTEFVVPGGGGDPVPVKSLREYIVARHKSVSDQLAGKSRGLVFQPHPADPFVGNLFVGKMDTDKDSLVSHQEFRKIFETWYSKWSDPETGIITYEGMADGINNDISPYGPDPRKKKLAKTEAEKSK